MIWRNTGWGVLGAVVTAPAALLTSVLLARWLDPAVNGQVQAALSLLTVLGFGAQLGTVAAGIHRITRARRPPALVVGTCLLSVTVTGGFAAAILSQLPLERWLLIGAPALTLAAVLPLLWTNVLAGAARALDRFADSTLAEVAHHVGRMLAVAVAALALPATAAGAMGAVLVAQGLAAAVAAARVLPRTGLAAPSLPELKATTSFGARTYLHTLAGQVHERVDLVLLAVLSGDAVEIATYAVAVGVVNRVRTVPLAMSSALFPQVAALSDAEGAKLTARVCRQALAWTVLPAVALAVVAPLVVPAIWGQAYAASVVPLWILLPGTVAFSAYLILGRYFQAIDRQGVNIAAQAAGVVLNVALNVWLIPRYGAAGAAAASLASYGLQGAWVTVAFVR